MCVNCNDPLQINLPTGATGPQGPAGAIVSVSATGLSAGSSPTVTNNGTTSASQLVFGIPAGATGATGSQGATGADGAYGGVTFPYTFSQFSASSADPTNGKVAFSGTTAGNTTSIYISNATSASSGVYTLGQNLYQSLLYNVNNTVKGLLKIYKKSDSSIFAAYQITAVTNSAGSWTTFTVSYLGGNGTLLATDNVLVSVTINGNSAINTFGSLVVSMYGPPTLNSSSYTYSSTFLGDQGINILYNSGTNTITAVTTNSTAIPASSFNVSTGKYTVDTTGYYQFSWMMILSRTSDATNGWWNSTPITYGSGAQSIFASVCGVTATSTAGNVYAPAQWNCVYRTRQCIMSGVSNVILLNAGEQYEHRVINATGYNYATVNGDVIKLSITRFA
jgi:hypothetical protein